MASVRRRGFLVGLTGGALLLVAGCQPEQQHVQAGPARLPDYTGLRAGVPAPALPGYVTPAVSEGYLFAVERPDVLRWLPCYCGCGLTSGHRSNLDCFIAGVGKDGSIVFDDHGSYCQTCVDIAADAKKLTAEGKSLPEIRAYVDKRHGDKGPGTDTPLPTADGARSS